MTTANEILEWNGLRQGTATKRDIIRAHRLADDGGTLQAGDALVLFGCGDPTLHTCMSLGRALIELGCEPIDD